MTLDLDDLDKMWAEYRENHSCRHFDPELNSKMMKAFKLMIDEQRRLRAVNTVLKSERDEVKVIINRMQKNIRPLLATMDDCVSEAMNPPRTG